MQFLQARVPTIPNPKMQPFISPPQYFPLSEPRGIESQGKKPTTNASTHQQPCAFSTIFFIYQKKETITRKNETKHFGSSSSFPFPCHSTINQFSTESIKRYPKCPHLKLKRKQEVDLTLMTHDFFHFFMPA